MSESPFMGVGSRRCGCKSYTPRCRKHNKHFNTEESKPIKIVDRAKDLIKENKMDATSRLTIKDFVETYQKIFKSIDRYILDSKDPLFEKTFDKVESFNTDRMNRYTEKLEAISKSTNSHNLNIKIMLAKRLERVLDRKKEIEEAKKRFAYETDCKFIGFIGWGEGCLESELQKKQNISAIDGYLFIDKTNTLKYHRFRSNYEKNELGDSEIEDIDLSALVKEPNASNQSLITYMEQDDIKEKIEEKFKIGRKINAHLSKNYTDFYSCIKDSVADDVRIELEEECVRELSSYSKLSNPLKKASGLYSLLSYPFKKTCGSSEEDDRKLTVKLKKRGKVKLSFNGRKKTFKASDFDIEENKRFSVIGRMQTDPYKPEVFEGSQWKVIDVEHDDHVHKKLTSKGNATLSRDGLVSNIKLKKFLIKSDGFKYFNEFKSDDADNLNKESEEGTGLPKEKNVFNDAFLKSVGIHKTDKNLEYQLLKEAVEKILLKFKIGADEEGCPCCNQGIDFDEFAAAIKTLLNSGNISDSSHSGSESIEEMVNSSEHWAIYLPSAAAAIIGLTAAYRNIVGAYHNRKKLKQTLFVNKICIELTKMAKGIVENGDDDTDQKEAKVQRFKKLLTNLKASKSMLRYSLFDTNFNLFVPGVVNGASSSAVISTGVVQNYYAIAGMTIYSWLQSARNVWDWFRVKDRVVDSTGKPSFTKPWFSNVRGFASWIVSAEDSMWNTKDSNKLPGAKRGIKKLNAITGQQRRFYFRNARDFLIFGTGGVILFSSLVAAIPTFGLSLAIGLPVGLSMFGYGALTTGIRNNWGIIKPRNSEDVGIDKRETDLKDCVNSIGEKSLLLDELKKMRTVKFKKTWADTSERFRARVLSALPYGPIYYVGHKLIGYDYTWKSQEILKRNDEARFDRVYGMKRNYWDPKYDNKKVNSDLNEILKQMDGESSLEPLSFQQQWKKCIKLGINDDIINHHIENHHSHDHSCVGGCDHDHAEGAYGDGGAYSGVANESFAREIERMDIFCKTSDGNSLELKVTLEQSKKQELQVTMLKYLLYSDGMLTKFRYQRRSISDLYWAIAIQENKDRKDKESLETV